MVVARHAATPAATGAMHERTGFATTGRRVVAYLLLLFVLVCVAAMSFSGLHDWAQNTLGWKGLHADMVPVSLDFAAMTCALLAMDAIDKGETAIGLRATTAVFVGLSAYINWRTFLPTGNPSEEVFFPAMSVLAYLIVHQVMSKARREVKREQHGHKSRELLEPLPRTGLLVWVPVVGSPLRALRRVQRSVSRRLTASPVSALPFATAPVATTVVAITVRQAVALPVATTPVALPAATANATLPATATVAPGCDSATATPGATSRTGSAATVRQSDSATPGATVARPAVAPPSHEPAATPPAATVRQPAAATSRTPAAETPPPGATVAVAPETARRVSTGSATPLAGMSQSDAIRRAIATLGPGASAPQVVAWLTENGMPGVKPNRVYRHLHAVPDATEQEAAG